MNGIGSTGLREESYDVVVTSGGFSSHAMSPNDITEVNIFSYFCLDNISFSQDAENSPTGGRDDLVSEDSPG